MNLLQVEAGDHVVLTTGSTAVRGDWLTAAQAANTGDALTKAIVPGRWFQTWYSPALGDREARTFHRGCGPTMRTALTSEGWKPIIFLTSAGTVNAVRRWERKARAENPDAAQPLNVATPTDALRESLLCVGRDRRAWTIQCSPRAQYGEVLDGQVWSLAPDAGAKDAVKAGEITVAAAREAYLGGLAFGPMGPSDPSSVAPRWAQPLAFGSLSALPRDGGWPVLVRPGDTLCCSAGRNAGADRFCPRAWAAELLAQHGWFPVLDGAAVQ